MSSEYKSTSRAYCYWLFGCCGTLGCQRCYLDDTFGGVAFCTTIGICGFGAIYDLLCLSCQVTEYNENLDKRLQCVGPINEHPVIVAMQTNTIPTQEPMYINVVPSAPPMETTALLNDVSDCSPPPYNENQQY
jgi:hypothetical protein